MSQEISPQLGFFIQLATTQSQLSRFFDQRINGISFTEFMILHRLHSTEGEKMRRIDLAEQIGLTPSGITRLILPMEKIGLVGRESEERDARIKFVTLTQAGKEKYLNESSYVNNYAISKFPESEVKYLAVFNKVLDLIHA